MAHLTVHGLSTALFIPFPNDQRDKRVRLCTLLSCRPHYGDDFVSPGPTSFALFVSHSLRILGADVNCGTGINFLIVEAFVWAEKKSSSSCYIRFLFSRPQTLPVRTTCAMS